MSPTCCQPNRCHAVARRPNIGNVASTQPLFAPNMANMNDKNLCLVKSIEKYPCLYNYNMPEYSKKEITDRAWKKVANETELTVPECREKWKNLRYGFIRSLRPNADGSSKKKYYLHDDMEFVLPFIKTCLTVPVRQSYMPLPNVEFDTDEENNIEFISSKENGESPQFLEYENILQRVADAVEPPRKKAKPESFKSTVDRTNPRKMFLLSLLPEVNELTERQMKRFRRKVLALLDDIVDTSNECDTDTQWQKEENQSTTRNHNDVSDNDVIIKSEFS